MKNIINTAKTSQTAVIKLMAALLTATLTTFSFTSVAEEATSEQQLQALKTDMVDIAADIQLLEQKMFYPDSEQVAVYLKVNSAGTFNVTSTKVFIDGEEVSISTYDEQQSSALNRGGVERLYIGDVDAGPHTITAIFSGVDGTGTATKRALTHSFNKQIEPTVFELSISYSQAAMAPVVSLNEL